MKLDFRKYIHKSKEEAVTKSFKVGSYSFMISVIALAILVAVNVFASALPTKFTQFDISSTRLYSLTSSSKVVVNKLEEDVNIYWICQSGQEDSVIEKLLNVYDDLSDHIKVKEKDPDAYPTFAEQYTDETVENNSLIVECGSKSRYIAYSDIYETDASYSTYGTSSSASDFDGEGEITTAIDYVTSDEYPMIYVLTGHGETDLSSDLTDAIERDNMKTEELTLLKIDKIPEDADCLIIYAPTSDFSEKEIKMLREYVEDDGHLMVFSGPREEGELTNLNKLLSHYGVSSTEGIVIEEDRDHYAFSYPYILLPDIESSEITSALINENSNVIIPMAKGLTIGDAVEGYTVTSLLNTSSDSFLKVDGYNISSYDKEDKDVNGPFSLAVSVSSDSTDGKMVWFASDYVTDDNYNSYSSGGNLDMVMNSISWMIGETDSISIRSKSLDYNYLTISASVASLIKIGLIGIVPLAYIGYGLIEVLRRRKKM